MHYAVLGLGSTPPPSIRSFVCHAVRIEPKREMRFLQCHLQGVANKLSLMMDNALKEKKKGLLETREIPSRKTKRNVELHTPSFCIPCRV